MSSSTNAAQAGIEESFGDVIERCSRAGCVAARLCRAGTCIGHATDEELDAAVASLHAGEPLDARHATISSDRLGRITDAAADGHGPSLGVADFRGAVFTGPADFSDVTFASAALFDTAIFRDRVSFRAVTFDGHADFDNVTFSGFARFERASFGDHAGFENAIFRGDGWFAGATFRGYVDLEGSWFGRGANFRGSTFHSSFGVSRA